VRPVAVAGAAARVGAGVGGVGGTSVAVAGGGFGVGVGGTGVAGGFVGTGVAASVGARVGTVVTWTGVATSLCVGSTEAT